MEIVVKEGPKASKVKTECIQTLEEAAELKSKNFKETQLLVINHWEQEINCRMIVYLICWVASL